MKIILFLASVGSLLMASAAHASWFTKTQNQLLALTKVSFEEWTGLAAIIACGIVIRFLVRFVVAKKMVIFFASTNFPYLEKLLKKLVTPLGNLAMAGFWAFCAAQLAMDESVLSVIQISIRIFACLSFIMLLYRTIDVGCHYLSHGSSDRNAPKQQLLPLFARASKIIIAILGAVFILKNLNVDISGLIAGMTLSGLAFSFAAKDAVANIFGSLTIFTDNSFRVGDYIKIGMVEGTVLSVGFRAARIKTPTHSIITIPNSKFTDSIVENMTMRSCRQVFTELKLDVATSSEKIEKLCEQISDYLNNHPAIQQDTYFVHFSDYADSALKIAVRFNVMTNSTKDEFNYRHEIFITILEMMNSLKIKLAHPSNSLIFAQETSKMPTQVLLSSPCPPV